MATWGLASRVGPVSIGRISARNDDFASGSFKASSFKASSPGASSETPHTTLHTSVVDIIAPRTPTPIPMV
eukprot:540285-Prorocentrum_minimum.AAC.4